MKLIQDIHILDRWWRYRQHNAAAKLPAHSLDCPGCGLSLTVPPLAQGQAATCPRCRHPLVRVERNPFRAPPALASAALILMLLVYSQLFILVELSGVYAYLTLPEMVRVLLAQDFGFLAEVMLALTFGTPALFCLLCLYVYGALVYQQRLPGLLYATRLLVRLRSWMMVDVFFISTLVAYIKLASVAHVTFGPAFWLMFALAVLLLRTAQVIPEHWVYFQIQRLSGRDPAKLLRTPHTLNCSECLYHQPANRSRCSVCGSMLHRRRPYSLRISSAFLLAALILYFPANLLPIMISSNPLNTEINTILDGIAYMWRTGDKLIAVIIFSASVAVPVVKIIAIMVLLYSAQVRPLLSHMRLAWLYRFTESVGRWSMVDIFVIIILMASFRTPLARVTAGPAAVYFCLVVLLTMFAAQYFDPRLLWDKIHAPAKPSRHPHAHRPAYTLIKKTAPTP